ncbi:MAG TPA: exodeoxyribonuclease VII large subunit [Acidimicrobiales bacterium]|nr:exodeoxyribonuclease VII large subunit [Acidimicrobiales bacterium]
MSLFDIEAAGTDEPRRLTLVRLSREVIDRLTGIGRVQVEGEVHGLKTYASGASFTLRDRAARISVWWSVGGRNQGQCRVTEGQSARVIGRVQFEPGRGSLRLAAEEALPTGAGAVAELVAEARSRLAAAGILDRERRALPRLPAAVGVVCGREAAVRRDIESVVAARWPGYPLRFCEVGVSGPAAGQSIAEGLARLSADPDVQVVILARGGGDAADLLPWSEEALCRAIAAAPVPVISAIGHEEDRPLCDEVADLRCGTPSLAATAVIPDRDLLLAELAGWIAQAEAAADVAAERGRRRLASLAPGRALDARAASARHRLGRAGDAVAHHHPRAAVVRARAVLASLEREREALSHVRVLERGYAVVRAHGSTAALRDASGVNAGDRVEITLAKGALVAAVEDVDGG